MKAVRYATCAVLVAATLAPAALAGGRNPGSVLIFPVQRTGGAGNFFTLVSVTNTNTLPAGPGTFGGSTSVHYEYVNTVPDPANPAIPLACTVFDRIEFLTPADTLSVATWCHNAVSPGGQQGYLVVSAQDPSKFNTPWKFDHLIGSELVVNAVGGVYSLNAIPFKAGAMLMEGDETDLADPVTMNKNGQLDFNDMEYEAIPDVLYIDSFVAILGSSLSLINLTGGAHARNTVQFHVWNDNEFPLSATLKMGCWFDLPLTQVSPLFDHWFLSMNTPHDPQELDINCDGIGTLETGWARIDSINVSEPGGGFIAADGALLGSITAGPSKTINGGHLLWESEDTQLNGSFLAP